MLMLTSCSYQPIIDSRGNKGDEVAYRMTDDLLSCKEIAKQNTNDVLEGLKVVHNWYIRPSLLFLPDKMEYNYKPMVDKCMTLRGHAVLS
tara:strand:+ start:186 stop:455 length:270 start_codon:yes stop_codon:yes gene_type:complete